MVVVWVTNYWAEKPLNTMSTDHIQKCILALIKGEILRPGCNGFTNSEWVQIFNTELRRRARYDIAV